MRKFLKKFEVTDIKKLTNYQINKLEVGDVVAKNTNGQDHNYIVSYKQNGVGMCLTYSDATYLETISYDYVEGNWVYNSQDSTVVASKSYVDSLMSGALKRTIVEALPETNIDTNTIYMVLDQSASQQGNVYNEYLYINNAWELIGTTEMVTNHLYRHDIVIKNPKDSSHNAIFNLTVYTNSETVFDLTSLINHLKDKNVSNDTLHVATGFELTTIGSDSYIWYAVGCFVENSKLYMAVVKTNEPNPYEYNYPISSNLSNFSFIDTVTTVF